MVNRQFVLDNLKFRLDSIYPGHSINLGHGNVYAKIIVVHNSHVVPERDGTSGALKRFNLLDEAYRVPFKIVDGISLKENRDILKEFLEIIRPLMVVSCGRESTEILKGKNLRSIKTIFGRDFLVEDLAIPKFCAILPPQEYSFASAPVHLKEQGRSEWERVVNVFEKLRHQQENSWRI